MQKDKKSDFDSFIKEKIKSEGLDSPSLDFTSKLISKIELQKKEETAVTAKPLISNYFWYSGAAFLLFLFTYLVYGNVEMQFSWIPELKLSRIPQLRVLEKMLTLQVSNVYVYAFIGLAFFVGIQVYILKSHFEKRYYLKI